MTLHHRCPQCESTLSAPDSLSGRRVRCPICAAELVLPADKHDDEAMFFAEPVDTGRQDEPPEQSADSSDAGTEPAAGTSSEPAGFGSGKSADTERRERLERIHENNWEIKMLDSLHGPAPVRQSYEPPAPSAENEPSASKGEWMQKMFAALLDPRSIQWLLTIGGGLMVLGGLIWLISYGVLQNKLVVAVILGVGSIAVLAAGWFVVLRTRYRIAGRALTFLGCIFVSLNLWFYHAQGLLPLDQGLWVAAAVCVIIYVATVRVLRDPLFVYAVEAGVTLTAVLLLGNFGLASSATHLSMLLMTMAMISIHGHLGFPAGKQEFNREDYGMPLFWSGHAQLGAAVAVLLGSQIAGWVHSAAMFFDLPAEGILLTNSRLIPGVLWLVAAYAYVYSDLAVRRVGVYMYLAAASLIMAESTVIGLDAWGMEGMIGLLAVTSAAVSLFAAFAPTEDQRLARVVAPLAFLIGVGPMLMGLWLHLASSSVVAVELGFHRDVTWTFVGVMALLAISNRISAYVYADKSPSLAAVYLYFTAASLLIAAAGGLHMLGVLRWQLQTPLLMLVPIGYLIASRLWRGKSPERPLAAIAQAAVVVLMLRALTGAALTWSEAGLADTNAAGLAVSFLELAAFYGLARWLRAYPTYAYLGVAAACFGVWQAMIYLHVPTDVFTIGFMTVGLGLLVASRIIGAEERTVYTVGGAERRLGIGPGAEIARGGHALLGITLLSTILKTASELINSGGEGTFTGLEWVVVLVGALSALTAAALSPNSGWRRAYAVATICLAALTLIEINFAINLPLWRKAELLIVAGGVALLGFGYVGRFREDERTEPNDMVSLGLWTGSLMAVIPLLLVVFSQWSTTKQFSLPDEFAFIAVSLLMLATGVVWRVKASTMLGGVSLSLYLCVLVISVIYQPQVAIGIYLAAGGALLFGFGLLLAVYRDRLAAIPERVANREGLFSVIAWR